VRERAFFRSLVPARVPRDHYVLIIDETTRDPGDIARDLDRALSAAHHYGHARALGQLAPARVTVVPRAEERVRDFHAQRGMKWGDRKHRLLVTSPSDDLLDALGRLV
jgi:hypothetical protein